MSYFTDGLMNEEEKIKTLNAASGYLLDIAIPVGNDTYIIPPEPVGSSFPDFPAARWTW